MMRRFDTLGNLRNREMEAFNKSLDHYATKGIFNQRRFRTVDLPTMEKSNFIKEDADFRDLEDLIYPNKTGCAMLSA